MLSKTEHRAWMLEYLERDKCDARRLKFVLGFKVWSRGADWPCPRAASLEGVYLVEDLPDLYPADCPIGDPHNACCCVLREFVFQDDDSVEATALRSKIEQRRVKMALINCWECGRQISNTAQACPHCGAAPRPAAPAPANSVTETSPPEPDGVCPNCGRGCALDASICQQCKATFDEGSAWKPRARRPGEVLPSPRTPPIAPATADQATATASSKGGSNWLLWIIGVPIGLFLLMLVIGANVSPQKATQWEKEKRADAMCDQLMSDSALGDERRMTRAICDRVKADIRSQREK